MLQQEIIYNNVDTHNMILFMIIEVQSIGFLKMLTKLETILNNFIRRLGILVLFKNLSLDLTRIQISRSLGGWEV